MVLCMHAHRGRRFNTGTTFGGLQQKLIFLIRACFMSICLRSYTILCTFYDDLYQEFLRDFHSPHGCGF